MASKAEFKEAFPFQNDILSLPVSDLDAASGWYSDNFGMTEVERRDEFMPNVILERDGSRFGFAVSGADPTQDGAGILVSCIHDLKDEFEAKGLKIGN